MTVIREHHTPQGHAVCLIHGDITQSSVDAIINAANAQLQHGGGVAGAIARSGGAAIQAESDEWIQKHGFIAHDAPALTSAGDLPCRHVIHAVGPIWGEGEEDRKLDMTVQSALRLAHAESFESVAMPAISTGIYAFPKDRGAQVILDAILSFLNLYSESTLKRIEITLIDELSVTIFAKEFDKRWGSD
jgi:O-acetyl-ADP-ribose deacetylase (regulator of RNase III)